MRHGGSVVVAAALLVYANSLANGFTLDDVPIVAANPNVMSAEHWWTPWVSPYWPHSNRGDRDDLLYRPLTIQTYLWQYKLHGPVAWPFHLVNVLLHAAVSFGVWRLARRLGASAGPARFAGLVFAVHAVHADAVSNIVGRAELLAAAGTLLAVICALRAADPQRLRRRSSETFWWLAAWLGATAALAAKENGLSALATVAFVAAFRTVRCARLRAPTEPRNVATGGAKAARP